MAYLFDTDAISEVLRRRPSKDYLRWLSAMPREEQFTSAVVTGELYKGAYRSAARELHLRNIEERVLPVVTVLPYDVAVSRIFGMIRAQLEETGLIIPDADLQIAATAIYHGLELVTGNIQHFGHIPGLRLNPVLARSRSAIPHRRG